MRDLKLERCRPAWSPADAPSDEEIKSDWRLKTSRSHSSTVCEERLRNRRILLKRGEKAMRCFSVEEFR